MECIWICQLQMAAILCLSPFGNGYVGSFWDGTRVHESVSPCQQPQILMSFSAFSLHLDSFRVKEPWPLGDQLKKGAWQRFGVPEGTPTWHGNVINVTRNVCIQRSPWNMHSFCGNLCGYIVCSITKSFGSFIFRLHLLLPTLCRPCEVTSVQSHQRLSRSVTAIATCEVQVCAIDFQTFWSGCTADLALTFIVISDFIII